MNISYKIPSSQLAAASIDPTPVLDKISTPLWNRLEGRPRGEDMTRALKAEVRDAAWMLSRQWQMGEFVADDAGTPVFSNLQYTCTPFSQQNNIPLEPKIENQVIFDATYPDLRNLNIRLQMGNYWLRLLTDSPDLSSLKASFINNAEFDFPAAPTGTAPDVMQFLEFYDGRSIDGYKFYNYYKDTSRFNSYGNKAPLLVTAYQKFAQWYTNMYLQPVQGAANAWKPSQLEYAFEATAGTRTVVADEYYQGRLDWYNFKNKPASIGKVIDVGASFVREYNAANPAVKSLIPAPVRFAGMPEARFWTFEDGATNFAAVNVDRNNIGKLALIEFGLVYSNDWCVVPVDAPVGCFLDVNNLTVVDSFGKEISIPAVADVNPTNLEWKYFALSKLPGFGRTQEKSLLFAPVISKAQQSNALEEVIFMRDEMANMVWGIESVVPSPLGVGISGRQAVTQPADNGDRYFYLERTNMPVNWVPFVPLKNIQGRLVLRRGKIVDGAGQAIRPNTSLLRLGLNKDNVIGKDASGKSIVYDVEDNEVPREGVKVTKAYQRTRWTNGEVYVWLGMQKESGKREGRSALAFDQMVKRV
jgi:hypothetical protein